MSVDPRRPAPGHAATLVDVLRWRADHDGERLAYRFLADGESRQTVLTYAELNTQARAIAARIQSRQDAGERTLLVYPPGLELVCAFLGCLYAGTVAILVHPPHRARLERFESTLAGIMKDATPSIALTTSAIQDLVSAPVARTTELRRARWMATDDTHTEVTHEWRDPNITPESLAFLQYTSGSTTEPRGVMVGHGNLMHNLRLMREVFGESAGDACVSWLPPYHDMGLIGGILAPLYLGSPVTLLPPLAFVQCPRRWLEALSRFEGAVSAGPNFAYDLCVRKITDDERAGLDLSHWKVAVNGAEPVNPTTLRHFAERFEPCGFDPNAFTPCYGLAESTLLVSAARNQRAPVVRGYRKSDLARNLVVPCRDDDAEVRALASCGPPAATTVIVNPDTRTECGAEEVGEIWVSGPSVAQGYWNRSAETAETFQAALDGQSARPFLKTGDLGFLMDGELFITGRLKDLIVIDGSNHYPQDIEKTVGECHPALGVTECVAFSVDVTGREELVIVAAPGGTSSTLADELGRAIRTAVARDHSLHTYAIVLAKKRSIPRTASGKLRRRACRAAYLAQALDVWGPP